MKYLLLIALLATAAAATAAHTRPDRVDTCKTSTYKAIVKKADQQYSLAIELESRKVLAAAMLEYTRYLDILCPGTSQHEHMPPRE